MNNQTVPDDVIVDADEAGLFDKLVREGFTSDYINALTRFAELRDQRQREREVEAVPDRNLEGVDEFLMAIVYDKPIWPNKWGQDVAMAAFKLTDNGKRATATPPLPPRELLEKAKDFLLYLNQSGVLTGEDKLRKHLVALMEENYQAIEAALIPTEKEPS